MKPLSHDEIFRTYKILLDAVDDFCLESPSKTEVMQRLKNLKPALTKSIKETIGPSDE